MPHLSVGGEEACILHIHVIFLNIFITLVSFVASLWPGRRPSSSRTLLISSAALGKPANHSEFQAFPSVKWAQMMPAS